MMEICIYVGFTLVLWIILSIQNLLGNAGRDQGDRDGWVEPWANDSPSLHRGFLTGMLRSVAHSCPVLRPHGLSPPGSSLHGDSPGRNTGVGCHALLQGIFPTQGSNPDLPHCRRILYQLSHQGRPRILEWVTYPFSRGSSRPRNRSRVSYTAGGFFTTSAAREAH